MKNKRPSLIRETEDWTGHTAARTEAVRLGLLFLGLVCLIAVVLWLTSCTQHPRMVRPDGSYVDLGRTFMKKSTSETTQWTDGREALIHTTTGADETVVPAAGIKSYTTLGVADRLLGGLRTTEGTKRLLAKEETSRAATKSAASVEKLRITTPPPAAATPAPVAVFDPVTGLNTVR